MSGDPFGEHTVTLREAIDDVDAQLDELADRMLDAEAGTAAAQTVSQLVSDAEDALDGLAWLAERHGPDAEITVRGLSAGQQAKLDDRHADLRAERQAPGNAPGSHRQVKAATGLVDAPFIASDADYQERLAALADQPVGVVRWIESEVEEATSLEGNGYEPFVARLRARREG